MITINELEKEIKNIGYYATEELIYDTFNALCLFENSEISSGQDIYAICLEGPPGAGKTEFAKTYVKLSRKIFNQDVEMVDYQCDATTGKTELFEDINISAAIRRDPDHVNIPGKLIDAINKVNEGKKVVLFIDEYDKAREETDAFLLQFLQSGKINSTQHGDLEIKDEYKSNLQVILCKNDMREELSGPLSRRIRIIRLDYMKPTTLYQVAQNVLITNRKNPVNSGLLNLVTLMYQSAYDKREMYDRLPSCSEMLIAIEDANRLATQAKAPQHVIYNTIIRNMFKSEDDIKTFTSTLKDAKEEKDEKLKQLIEEMQKETEKQETDINDMIAQNIFTDESEKLREKTIEMQNLINDYSNKFKELEEKKKREIEEEIRKISLENGKLVANNKIPNVIRNFEDETNCVKRGYDIFELANYEWNDIAFIYMNGLSHSFFVEKLIEYASQIGVKVYENGILLQNDGEQKLIAINDLDDDKNPRYRILSSMPVIPSTYLDIINHFKDLMKSVLKVQPKKNESKSLPSNYSINALVYNDEVLDFDTESENVYHIDILEPISNEEKLQELLKSVKCGDINNATNISKKIMSEKAKQLVK